MKSVAIISAFVLLAGYIPCFTQEIKDPDTSVNALMNPMSMIIRKDSKVNKPLSEEQITSMINKSQKIKNTLPATAPAGDTNIWIGTVHNNWFDNSSWSLGHYPPIVGGSYEDIIITDSVPVVFDSEPEFPAMGSTHCSSLTINPDAILFAYFRNILCDGDAYIYGTLEMDNNAISLTAENIIWGPNSIGHVPGHIDAVNWTIEDGANLHFTVGYQAVQGEVRCFDQNSYFKTLFVYGETFEFSALSTSPLRINDHIVINSPGVLKSNSEQSIILSGYIHNFSGNIALDHGTFEFNGGNHQVQPGDYFNNVIINGENTFDNDFVIKGNLLIESGSLNIGSHTLTIYGNWTDLAGENGFVEPGTTVVFAGGTNQTCNGETFNTLKMNKTSGSVTIPTGTTTTCSSLQWDNYNGELLINGGTFIANELTQDGIYGKYRTTNNGGLIELHQDEYSTVNLNGRIEINSGTMNIYCPSSSNWASSALCILWMNGGVLDFKTSGINIAATSYNLNDNITGGTIRTSQSFICSRSDFTPSAGTIELYGGTDKFISTTNGSNVYNLLINKSGGDDGSKSNTITTSNILNINNSLTVEEGTFLADNYTTTCLSDITVNSGGKLSIGDAGTLAAGPGINLTINNGGILDLTGTSTNAATLTHSSGYYGLNIESGGMIGAYYGVFEYMNTLGINIKSGALVDAAKTFNYSTFRLGQSSGRLLTIENSQTFAVGHAVFPTNTWSGSYNVYKSANSGTVNFSSATGGFAGEDYDYDPNNRILWEAKSLSLKAFLEGPFNGTNMTTTLNSVLPISQPFSPALPYFGNSMPDWYYAGTENVTSIPNTNVVDWVLVELRDAFTANTATKSTMVAQLPGFILNNGNIVALDGVSNLQFANTINNNLYVVIYQRNHESIMNANPIPFASDTYMYDFSTGVMQVFGYNSGHKLLGSGIWGMRSGDGNGDGNVNSNDKTNVWKVNGQNGKSGYLPSDYNMDRQTNNKDKNDKWRPNNGTESQVPN
jgi:hypothetical protein